MNRFLAAIRFLTIVPVPGTRGTAAEDLVRSVPMFPVVGLLLGAAGAAMAWAVVQVAPPMLAAAAMVVVLISFSGALHLDGLADTADGLLSSRPRERMLEIMRDSHIGAMGVAAMLAVVLVKFSALTTLAAEGAERLWPTVLLMPLAGRAAMPIHMALLPYARPSGLGAVFCQQRPWRSAIWAISLLVAVAWGALRLPGLAAAGASLAATLLLAIYVYRKLGGATGDTFGAACELVETVPAVVLACWPIEAAR